MSARNCIKIHTKTVRGMLSWSHYEFRQRLINKSELFSDCKLIECEESFTCKTCGYCGVINDKLGCSKVFKCKQENCQPKLIVVIAIFMQLEIFCCVISHAIIL